MAKKDIYYQICVFFGAGLAKKAPGTMGSLASLVIWAPLAMMRMPYLLRLVLVFAVFFVGLYAIKKATACFQGEDPKEIVIDEVAGQGLALALCGPSILGVLVGFGLFRFFDILKPWPIRVIDKQMKGPMGIMLDDMLAGFFVFLIFAVIRFL